MSEASDISAASHFGADVASGRIGKILPWLVYPITIASCLSLYFLFRGSGMGTFWASIIPAALGGAAVMVFEWLMPERSEWAADRDSVQTDAWYVVIVQLGLPRILSFLVVLLSLRGLNQSGWTADLWVHDWPIGAQAVLMLLVADFFRYWLHVACHHIPFLWRLHAVHHSPKKLYWLNVGRFHPLEKSMQFVFDALPFILIGVGEDVLGLYFVFYTVNGAFQHCNIHLRFGWLNYVISTAELHRWHHSKIARESNTNFGNNVIVWDLLFGTRFLPQDHEVGELGLLNSEYPLDFRSQLKAPFISGIETEPAPLGTWREILLNLLLRLKMTWVGWRDYRPMIQAAQRPADVQRDVLKAILKKYRLTEFGAEYDLSEEMSIAEYQARVPVHDYEQLRPYIERQDQTGALCLTPTRPVMFNVTSGTTGLPKYLPVLAETLRGLKRNQRLSTYVQYRLNPHGFRGKILSIVGPAVEGYLESGTPYGSASGSVYKNTTRLARAKCVLPPEVFELEDYETKYYTMLRLAIEQRDITFLVTANPSTFLRLLDLFAEHRESLLTDIEHGTLACEDSLPTKHRAAIMRLCHARPKRARELRDVLDTVSPPTLQALWPYLQLVATWTGGSCGIALASLKSRLPKDITMIGLGILASELSATVTVDPRTNAGVPTFWENFFEFVEVVDYEQNRHKFLTLDQVEEGKDYYMFVTTQAGLFRYAMHDIVRVIGKFQNTPTLSFLQKGAGVTSITGEKLYESQLVQAMQESERECDFHSRFFQFVADEDEFGYLLYLETDDSAPVADVVAEELDCRLSGLNSEYEAKRKSGRLRPPRVLLLRTGTYDSYKQQLIERGRSEAQFKILTLRYRRDLEFDFDGCVLPSDYSSSS